MYGSTAYYTKTQWKSTIDGTVDFMIQTRSNNVALKILLSVQLIQRQVKVDTRATRKRNCVNSMCLEYQTRRPKLWMSSHYHSKTELTRGLSDNILIGFLSANICRIARWRLPVLMLLWRVHIEAQRIVWSNAKSVISPKQWLTILKFPDRPRSILKTCSQAICYLLYSNRTGVCKILVYNKCVVLLISDRSYLWRYSVNLVRTTNDQA